MQRNLERFHTHKGRINFLESVIDINHLEHVNGGTPVMTIRAKKGYEQQVYERLQKLPNATVRWKADIPSNLHYKNNVRVLDIEVGAKFQWSVAYNNHSGKPDMQLDKRKRVLLRESKRQTTDGDHGWVSSIPQMHPYLIALGPSFKSDFATTTPFNNTDIYPLICHILGAML